MELSSLYKINEKISPVFQLFLFSANHCLFRMSTGLENPGKSLNWKKIIPGLESL
jgi:hypothetical protein